MYPVNVLKLSAIQKSHFHAYLIQIALCSFLWEGERSLWFLLGNFLLQKSVPQRAPKHTDWYGIKFLIICGRGKGEAGG